MSLPGSQELQPLAEAQNGKPRRAAAGPAAAESLTGWQGACQNELSQEVWGSAGCGRSSEGAALAKHSVAACVLERQCTGSSAAQECQIAGPSAAAGQRLPVSLHGRLQGAAASQRQLAPCTGVPCSVGTQGSLPQGGAMAGPEHLIPSTQQPSVSPVAAQQVQPEGLAGSGVKPELAGSRSAQAMPTTPHLRQVGVTAPVQTSRLPADAVSPAKPDNIGAAPLQVQPYAETHAEHATAPGSDSLAQARGMPGLPLSAQLAGSATALEQGSAGGKATVPGHALSNTCPEAQATSKPAAAPAPGEAAAAAAAMATCSNRAAVHGLAEGVQVSCGADQPGLAPQSAPKPAAACVPTPGIDTDGRHRTKQGATIVGSAQPESQQAGAAAAGSSSLLTAAATALAQAALSRDLGRKKSAVRATMMSGALDGSSIPAAGSSTGAECQGADESWPLEDCEAAADFPADRPGGHVTVRRKKARGSRSVATVERGHAVADSEAPLSTCSATSKPATDGKVHWRGRDVRSCSAPCMQIKTLLGSDNPITLCLQVRAPGMLLARAADPPWQPLLQSKPHATSQACQGRVVGSALP